MSLAEATMSADTGAAYASDSKGSKPRPRRKRKATVTRRKVCAMRIHIHCNRDSRMVIVQQEEIEELEEEVKALQAQIAAFQKNAETAAKHSELEQDLLETSFIRQAVLQQHASLVNVQSALSRLTMTQSGAPHATSICLGTDLEARWKTLTEMKPIKLQAAQYYLKERGRYVDDTSAFSYYTRFMEEGGWYCSQIYDVVPFEGISSVKLVFDALQYYFSNMEIRVTECLGDITIREDDGSSEPGISQCRFVSYLTSGPLLETNSIICSEFKEADDEYGDGGPVGIFTEDFVDQDDLYPYFPEERIRQDVSVVTQVRSHVKNIKNAEGVEEEQPIVVMQRWAYSRIHKPKLPLSPEILHEIRDKSSHWGDVKLVAVREMVYRSTD
ncbi:hypothetical protein JG687_00008095 [Phytophthora cactorum]|uniref:Uncharacterized protein n=1 Tax=Phytophthora cactorum TaxID=29920 RepID=A0A8T1UHY1_9STRA|nr:hypothetical protein JG687_00008095 [Phytophthora cactorum]